MDDLIRIRSGNEGDRKEMPPLQYARKVENKMTGSEIAYHTEEEALYIGTPTGNKRLCGTGDLAMIKELQSTLLSLSKTIEDMTTRLSNLETPSE